MLYVLCTSMFTFGKSLILLMSSSATFDNSFERLEKEMPLEGPSSKKVFDPDRVS